MNAIYGQNFTSVSKIEWAFVRFAKSGHKWQGGRFNGVVVRRDSIVIPIPLHSRLACLQGPLVHSIPDQTNDIGTQVLLSQ